MRNNKGFTLVELAIVLVIIGIIIGGVIKGQALVQSAKAKRVYRDFQSYMTAYNTYQDRNNAIPGDASPATGSIVATAGKFWTDLRTDNLIPGTSTDSTAPNDIYGAALTLGNSAATTFGIAKNSVCMNNVPMASADQIDTTYDDGDPATGDIRANTTATGISATAATDYTTDTTYLMCFSLD